MDTLLKSYVGDKWYPTPINTYKNNIIINLEIENARALQSNIAYSLQYIEFLEKELTELHLSTVIKCMLIKTYVITGMSILEGLFTNIIKTKNLWKTSTLKSIGTTQSNLTNFSGTFLVAKTELFQEVDPFNERMNLDDLIKILNNKHEILDIDHTIYPALKRLKDLRNKVHLQKSDNNFDHDYNSFIIDRKKEMGKILFEILTSSSICRNPETFEFLKVNMNED